MGKGGNLHLDKELEKKKKLQRELRKLKLEEKETRREIEQLRSRKKVAIFLLITIWVVYLCYLINM